MSIEELRELCAATVELTRMRQSECKHLAIENFAPELLGKLIRERMAMGQATLDAAVAAERERCANVAESWGDYYNSVPSIGPRIARAIRGG